MQSTMKISLSEADALVDAPTPKSKRTNPSTNTLLLLLTSNSLDPIIYSTDTLNPMEADSSAALSNRRIINHF